MQGAVDKLIEILDLEVVEENIFRGRSPQEDRQRVFGGQVAGQALVAAGRTVEDPERMVHSLHAYFLRPGDPSIPILYTVDRIRDGKSFTTRRVVAVQRGKAIFHLSASFQRVEKGLEHQAPMPEAPDPESLPNHEERVKALLEKVPGDRLPADLLKWTKRERTIDVRPVNPQSFLKPEKQEPRSLVWIRADGRLPDDPLMHQYVAAYASDMTLLDVAMRPHGIAFAFMDPRFQMASLDHAMWFHHPFRADEWLLYAQESPASSGARGFATGNLFTRNGKLVVSVAQEGLIRVVEPL